VHFVVVLPSTPDAHSLLFLHCLVLYCQISKLLGARVVAVTSGADKATYLKQLGADAVVDTAAAAGQRLHKQIAAAAPKGEGLLVVCFMHRVMRFHYMSACCADGGWQPAVGSMLVMVKETTW
jgi:NADPH:quinone reductase-like Zn-dependent oxidoreductase